MWFWYSFGVLIAIFILGGLALGVLWLLKVSIKMTPQKLQDNFWEFFWISLWFMVVNWFIIFTFVIETSWSCTIVLGSLISLLLVVAIYYGFAPLNICFTFVKEGTAKVVVCGDAVVNILYQYRDHEIDADWNISSVPGAVQPSFLGFGGLRFYGVWPFYQIYTYPFSWASIDQDGEKKEHVDQWLDYILIKDALYWFNVKEAEDINLVPLNLEGLMVIRITNPYKALFNAQNWLKIVTALTQKLLKGEVGEKVGGYRELLAGKSLLGEQLLEDPDSVILFDKVKEDYGLKVVRLDIKDIDPPNNFRDLTMKKVAAEQEREATVVAADAEAKRVERVYSAVKKQGVTGRLVRTLESLEKSADKGSKMIIPLPGLTDILEKVFRKKKGP